MTEKETGEIPAQHGDAHQPQETSEFFWRDILRFTLVAVLIVLPIRMFIIQPFIVSGASMHPTFESGDYLIVD